jgi:hypothetical protein
MRSNNGRTPAASDCAGSEQECGVVSRCGLQATRNCAKHSCRLPLFVGDAVALQPKAPYSKRVNTAAEDATCEWRLCAHTLFASSALSRENGSTCWPVAVLGPHECVVHWQHNGAPRHCRWSKADRLDERRSSRECSKIQQRRVQR